MRSFFLQMFLSFWISTIITFELAGVIFPSPTHLSYEASQSFLRRAVDEMSRLKSQPGPDCEAWKSQPFFLIDTHGQDVCGGSIPAQAREAIAAVRKTGEAEYRQANGEAWAAQPAADRQYVALFFAPVPAHSWFPHMPPWAFPVSAVVTFVLAYLLTNPVRALRAAFRKFAAGDMAVRLPVSRSALRDWGGADIRTLMIDFNEMADRIQALIEAHRTLLRDVSHELRSPLARLNVALELAREESPDVYTSLDRAELESSRLNALIGELLSLSSMEALQNVPNQRLISLGDLVDELMPDLIFEAEARNCRIVHENRDGCEVMGSEDLLRRALENVIRNAIRYSPSEGRITVETTREAEQSVVRVCDSGPGVPAANLAAIFRPFYRVDSARQSSTGGFGVGLAIADRAIQIHGGTIRAFNQQSGGLCVELSVPCGRATAAS